MKEKNKQKSYKEEVLANQVTNPTSKGKLSFKNKKNQRKKESFIPKEVANRMARRIAFTTGIPTLLGMGVFILSYILITKGITDVAPSLTLVSSALFFLLGLLGLSYGILSASWEEEPGSLLGLSNIGPNIKKMRAAFQTTKPPIN